MTGSFSSLMKISQLVWRDLDQPINEGDFIKIQEEDETGTENTTEYLNFVPMDIGNFHGKEIIIEENRPMRRWINLNVRIKKMNGLWISKSLNPKSEKRIITRIL